MLSRVGSRFAMMWSGGKDSALALDRARRAGIEVTRRGKVRRPQLAFGTC